LGATRKVRVEPAAATALYPFLAGCSELALAAVRKQWPFVASVVMSYQDSGRQDIRPALLFGAASCADGALPDNRWADVAAATELTMLGMLALTATAASPDATQRGVDWTSASAVLAGDFLLSQAGLLVAGRQAELAALRGACLSGSSADNDPRPFFAALFEFPARIGAQVSGAADRTVAVLREFGRLCGRIFVHVEDYLGLAGEPGRLDTTLQGLLAAKLSALPYLLDSELDAAILLQDDELRRRALVASRDGCLAEHRAATALLAEIGAGTAHRILLEFCSVLAEPVLRDPGETPSVPQRGSQ
jgi:geranylgeranyl pyrophosphate synthase